MKTRVVVRYLCLAAVLFLTSCIKQTEKQFQGNTVVEFDATVLNSATSPYSYYVATKVPNYGNPGTTATNITRTLATPVKLRVNLVGVQHTKDEVITYKVVSNVDPVSPNMVATAGTHFNTASTFTIPANSSFGEVVINIVDPGTASTNPREVHLELVGNETIKPSELYKRIAIRIAQN